MRQEADLSQVALAAMLLDDATTERSMSQAVLSAWELGRLSPHPFPQDVFALERAIGVSPGTLSAPLGYVPVAANGPTTSPEAGILADESFTAEQKRLLSGLVRQLRRVT